jgi:hypothetical protein
VEETSRGSARTLETKVRRRESCMTKYPFGPT